MFSSMKKIIAILLCVAMTLTNAGVSTFATSIERVATMVKQVDSNRRTIDYRFYEAFKYEKRTSYLMKDDESDSLKESMQQSEPSSVVGENTKTGDDVNPSFDVGNNDANDDKSRATSSDADDDSENDDENTTGNNIEEPEDDGANNKVSDDDTDTATVSDADDSSGSAATDEPEDDDTDTATVSDVDDSSGSAATDETEDDDIDTATTSDADTTVNSSTNDEDENGDTTATTSDAADKEASNKNDENDDTTATTSNADVLNDDNKASDSDAKKLPLNLQPMIASDSESTLFGVTAYTLPNTWYNVTSAGAAKANVQSITISKYPTPAPTTYTHNYTIPGSDGLEVYANVTGTGTSQRSDVTIYAPENKTIYAAEDSSEMFREFRIITNLDLSNLDTSNVTDMEFMFWNCLALTSLDLSSFNTASVSNMNYMFDGCRALTSLDLSNFNTSKVTDMSYMFYHCEALTSLDLSSFNTASVSNMSRMFLSCQALTSLDVSSFNTSNVTNMCMMFWNCQALTSLDLSNFNTSNVTNMQNMFADCQTLTNLNVSNFDTSNVTNMSQMFDGCRALTSLDLSNFNTSKVTDMRNMFNRCDALTTIIASTSFVTTAVTAGNDADMFTDCNVLEGGNGTKYADRYAADPTTAVDKTYAKIDRVGDPGYFTFTGPYYTLPNTWYNVTSAGASKYYVQSITISKYPTPAPTTYTHNYTIPGSDGLEVYANVTGTGTSQRSDVTIYAPENKTIYAAEDSSRLFYEFRIITSLDLSNLDTSNVINMVEMFCNCRYLTTIIASTSFVTTAVTAGNDADMFSGCNVLEGGNGTKWSDRNAADPTTANNKTYAWIDGRHAQVGYFRGTGDGSGSGTDGDGTKVYSIRIKASPSKIDYEVTNHFNPAGLVLEVQWTDGYKSEVIYNSTTERDFIFNPATTSELQLTDTNVVITYRGKNIDLPINMSPSRSIDSIIVKKKPKTRYNIGDSFNPAGLEITVLYKDKVTRDISYVGNEGEFSFTPMTINNDCDVTLTYKGMTAKIAVTVAPAPTPYSPTKELDSILIKTLPKTLYVPNETFDPTNLEIIAKYTDNTSSDIPYLGHELEFSFKPVIIATKCDVEVNYRTKTATISVLTSNVPPVGPDPSPDKEIDTIVVKTYPKTHYKFGETFDPTGLEITVNYVDTTSVDVAYAGNEMSFSFTPIIINKNGNVTIIYKGKNVDLPIEFSNYARLKGNGGKFVVNMVDEVDTLTYEMNYGDSTSKFIIPNRLGYRFNGYYVGSEKIKATWSYVTSYTIDVDARWLANSYKVKFDNNGGVGNLPVRIATYDETFRTPSTGVTKDGYQLSGWMYNGNFYSKNTNVSNLTSIHDDVVTLVASWSGLTYDIIYHGNGATGGNTANQLNLTYGIDHTLNANGFTKTDYTFNGWALSVNSTVVYGDGATIVKEEDYRPVINLYAKWIKTSGIAGTLTLQGNGGLINGVPTFVQSYLKDEPIAEVSIFRRGYNFDHWSDAGTVVTYPSKWDYTVNAVTLDANWNNKTFQVRYVRNDSDFPYAEDISAAMNYGASYTPITAGSLGWTKAKHTFSGWSYRKDATTKDIDAGVSVVLDTDYVVDGYINLYPVWEGETYDITYSRFDPSNFALNRTENYTYGSNERIIAPATFSYIDALGDKYIFAGWTRNTTDTVAEFSSGIKADTIYDAFTVSPISIVGLWIKESDAVYLTFDAGEGNTIDGGDRVLTKVYSYGDTITYPINVHKRGHLLGETTTGPNWRDAKNGNAFNEAIVNFREDKTVNACYRIGQYHLTYVSPQLGITGTTVDKNYDENFAIDDFTTERIAYTFVGWDIDANANVITYTAGQSVSGLGDVDEYVTLFTVWDEKTYTIKYFDQNNNQFATANLKINDYSIIKTNPNIPENAADKGYRYEGGISHTVKRFNAGQLVTLTDFEYSNTITEFNLYDEIESDFYGKVENITITKNPKHEYIIGQKFDPSGLEISAKYNDGTITPNIKYNENKGDFTFDISLENPLDRLGNIVVTVTYKGAHTTFNISVRDWYPDENVSSIKITKKPQTKYAVDDTLNPTGLEIEVTYTDGRSNRTVAYNNNKAMFAFNPNTTKKLQLSDKKVTVSFGGMKASYDIVVEEIPVDEGVSDIKIIKPPVQVNYIVGQKLDPSGLVIEVAYKVGSKNYKDGTKKQVSYDEYVNKFSFNPNTDKALALTDENVTVTFGSKTDIFAITVIEAVNLDKDVSSIKIKKVPDKVDYFVSEKLNPSGLVMEVTYSNTTKNLLTKLFGNNIKAGKTFLVDYNTYSDLFGLVPGTEQLLNINNKIVTVTFGGKKATFDITVSKNSNAYGPSNGGGGGGGRKSGGLPVTEMNTVVETMTLSSDYDWMYDEEGQREGVKLKKDSALAKSLMSSNDYKENYKESIEEGYIQIQNGFYNLQYAGASFYFGFSPVGKMLTGFVKTKDDTKHYWVDDTKNTLTDIGKQDSAKYYLYNDNGDYKGIIWNLPITISNILYTFDESGRVLTETQIHSNEVVAFSNTGWEYNPTDDSWKYYNIDSMGNRYYIKDEVKEITDCGVSHYYIFGEDEKMKTGLTEYKGKTYYLLESGDYKGAVYTGMLPLGGKVLIFDEQGILVSDNNEVKALTTTQ